MPIISLLIFVFVFPVPSGASDAEPIGEPLDRVALEVIRLTRSGDSRVLTQFETPETARLRKAQSKDRNNRLYCYVFNSACSQPQSISVREAMVSWKKPSYSIRKYDRGRRAVIYFFDVDKFAANDLKSAPKSCDAAYKVLFSWKFRLFKGRWVSESLPFDEGTDSLCNPEED
jgi:hypothetical protein